MTLSDILPHNESINIKVDVLLSRKLLSGGNGLLDMFLCNKKALLPSL